MRDRVRIHWSIGSRGMTSSSTGAVRTSRSHGCSSRCWVRSWRLRWFVDVRDGHGL